jgi:hypothetical protein
VAENEQQGAGAKRSQSGQSGQRRRTAPTAPKAHDAEAEVKDEAEADVADTPGDAPEAEPAEQAELGSDAPQEGGAQTPPAPPTPRDDAPADGETAEASENEPFPKAVLLRRADRLLGVDAAVARGVLAEADDPITIADAKARISAFLTGSVENQEASR